MLPANLAGIGSIAIIGWLITIVGAVSLGLVFAKLTEINTGCRRPVCLCQKSVRRLYGIPDQSGLLAG